MILHIPFTTSVKLHSIQLIAAGDARPLTLHAYTNRPDIDFAMADALTANQVFTLTDDTTGDIVYPVKAAKFQNVSSLQIVCRGRAGGDGGSSEIFWMELRGESSGDVRKVATNIVYESVARPQDHGAMEESRQTTALE